VYPFIGTALSRKTLYKNLDGIFKSGNSTFTALRTSDITPTEYGEAMLVPQNLSDFEKFGTVEVAAPGATKSGFATSPPREEKCKIISLSKTVP